MSTNLTIEREHICQACEHWYAVHGSRDYMARCRAGKDGALRLTDDLYAGPSRGCPLARWPDVAGRDYLKEIGARQEASARRRAERVKALLVHFAPGLPRKSSALQSKLDRAVTAGLLGPEEAARLAAAFAGGETR